MKIATTIIIAAIIFLLEAILAAQPAQRPGLLNSPRLGGGKSIHQFTIPHSLDQSMIKKGYNLVVDKKGNEVLPRGRPIQEGYRLIKVDDLIKDHNKLAYARVFSIMAPIRDALIFNIKGINPEKWRSLIEILQKNNIKTDQRLDGPTPRDNYYSNEGIYDHLKNDGPDYHPMMKYLEEAELELKCRLFLEDFDFTNPEGVNTCPDPGKGLVE